MTELSPLSYNEKPQHRGLSLPLHSRHFSTFLKARSWGNRKHLRAMYGRLGVGAVVRLAALFRELVADFLGGIYEVNY
jgi:hypothetical protein